MGFTVLVYNGDQDYMANWIGAQSWTEALVWRYQDYFINEKYQDWRLNENSTEASGQFKTFDGLTLLNIYGAGRMVPRDQPEAALQMITEFINNRTLIFK